MTNTEIGIIVGTLATLFFGFWRMLKHEIKTLRDNDFEHVQKDIQKLEGRVTRLDERISKEIRDLRTDTVKGQKQIIEEIRKLKQPATA